MPTQALKPIETRAYGRRFRSRLEARWAVAFTHAFIKWEYEPEGFDLGESGLYLPDFWLPQVSMWAEVKATEPTDNELRKANALSVKSGFPCMLFVGTPAEAAYWAISPNWGWEAKTLGDGTIIKACDYAPFNGDDYHETESRFFSGTGLNSLQFPMPSAYESSCHGLHPAVEAARSARFEHGESP